MSTLPLCGRNINEKGDRFLEKEVGVLAYDC
jgi:hypothetical protein